MDNQLLKERVAEMKNFLMIVMLMLAVAGCRQAQKAPTQHAASALAAAAAATAPGSWTRFTAAENASWNGGRVLDTPYSASSDNATTWSSKSQWDAVNHRFVFFGGGHCGMGSGCTPWNRLLLVYTESTGNWTQPWSDDRGHTYESGTLNTNTGAMFYLREFASSEMHTVNMSTYATGNMASLPYGNSCCNALEYFPDRNSLISIDNDYGIYEYSLNTNSWSGCLFNTSSSMGCPGPTHNLCGPSSTYSPWARYDPIGHRLMLGGCSNVYALSSSGALTSQAAAPFNLSTTTSASPVAMDQGTGKLLSWSPSNGHTYASDGQSWVDEGSSPFGNPVTGGLSCAGVSTYGVVMCFYAGSGSKPTANGQVWLYRLKESGSGGGGPVNHPIALQESLTTSASITRSSSGGSGGNHVTRPVVETLPALSDAITMESERSDSEELTTTDSVTAAVGQGGGEKPKRRGMVIGGL